MSGPNSHLPSDKSMVEDVHTSEQARKRRIKLYIIGIACGVASGVGTAVGVSLALRR